MIQASVEPLCFEVGGTTKLSVKLLNTGPGICTGIYLSFQLPVELAILRGQRQIRLPCLEIGHVYEHNLQVHAGHAGNYNLLINSFSYSDASGDVIQVPRLEFPLRVEAADHPPSVEEPCLELGWEMPSLYLNQWGGLIGRVSNIGPVPAHSVSIVALGPMNCVPVIIPSVLPAQSVPFLLKVYPTQAGQFVPAQLQVEFQHGNAKKGGNSADITLNVQQAHTEASQIVVQGDMLQAGAKKVQGDEIYGSAQKGDRVEITRSGSSSPASPPAHCCKYCGGHLYPEDHFCSNCGQAVPSP